MQKPVRKLATVFWAVVLLYVPLHLVSLFKSWQHERQQTVTPRRPAQPQPEVRRETAGRSIGPRNGAMQILSPPLERRVGIPRYISSANYPSRGNSTQFYSIKGKPVVCIAYGGDLNAYYANGFFKGFIPYRTASKWSAMQHVATHMQYMLDEKQFRGFREIWLSSEETYKLGRGDCEDHAILLADWLQSMGYDARVAFGKINGEGHAWVVLFENGRTYLLEATAKYTPKVFPLAAALPQYRPRVMFNDRYIWFNRGSEMTTSYTGANWVKTGRFFAY